MKRDKKSKSFGWVINSFSLPVFLLALCFTCNSHALSSDRKEKIKLTSNHFTMENAKGVSTYTGNVVMTQGTLKITGDKLVIHLNSKKELEKYVITGTPSTYKQLPDGEKEYINASANTIDYISAHAEQETSETSKTSEKVTLIENAKLYQKGNDFTGDKIEYFVAEDLVKAESSDDKKPVTIIITPTSSDESNE